MKNENIMTAFHDEVDESVSDSETYPKIKSMTTILMMTLFIFLWMFSYIPLTKVFGLIAFYKTNPFMKGPIIELLATVPVYFILLFAMLVFPVTRLAYPVLQKKIKATLLRVVVLAIYFIPPLVAFAYYRGGVVHSVDFQEIGLIVIPPAFIAAIIFESTLNSWITAFFLGLSTWVPIFLVNDALGTFNTYISIFTNGPSYYYWRAVLPLTSIPLLIIMLRATPRASSK